MGSKKKRKHRKQRPPRAARPKRRKPKGGRPLFAFDHVGSSLTMQSLLDEKGMADVREGIKAAVPADVQKLRTEVAAAFAPFSPLDLIATTWFVAQVQDLGAQEWAPAVTEYVGLMCAERAPAPRYSYGLDPMALYEAVAKHIPDIEKIVIQSLWLRMASQAGARAPTDLDDLAIRRFLTDTLLRAPAAWRQEQQTIEELFADPEVATEIERKLGFLPDEGMAFIDRLADLIQEAVADEAGGFVASAMTPGPDPNLAHAYRGWRAFRASAALVFTVDELAPRLQIPAARVRAIVDALSVDPPLPSPKTPFFPPDHVFRMRPLVQDGTGAFVCASPGHLMSCLRPRFEEVMRAWNWSHYEALRAHYLETKTATILEDVLRPTRSLVGAKYSFVDESGQSVDGETDALFVLDDALFVVEAKAGTQDRKTARLKRDVGKLVDEAVGQAEKALEAIAAGTLFRSATGDELDSSDLTGVTMVFPIVVTLEAMSWVAPATAKAVQAGLVRSTVEPPWVVSVHDLELIASVLEFPAQVPHYILGRREIEAAGIDVLDEIEAFGAYLDGGVPAIMKKAKGMDVVLLHGGWAKEIDRYSLARTSGAAGATPPRQQLSNWSRKRLAELDDERPPGFLEESFRRLAPPSPAM